MLNQATTCSQVRPPPPIFNDTKLPDLGSREVPTLRTLFQIFSKRNAADQEEEYEDDKDNNDQEVAAVVPELEVDELIESDRCAQQETGKGEGDSAVSGSYDNDRSRDRDNEFDVGNNGPEAPNSAKLVSPHSTENDSIDWVTTCEGYDDDDIYLADKMDRDRNCDDTDDEESMNEKFKEPVLDEFKRVPLPELLLRDQQAFMVTQKPEIGSECKPLAHNQSKVSLPHLHDAISLLWAIDAAAFDSDPDDLANTSFASSVSVVDVSMNNEDWRPLDYQPDFDFQVAMDSWAWEDVPSQMLDYVVGNPVPRRCVLGGLQYFFREYRKIREN
ncbi:hypothetical protein V1509DRAFT_263215 [Lipomyces kononenkoae]